MKEYAALSDQYEKIADQVIDENDDLRWIREMDIRIGYMTSDREKKKSGCNVLGECILVKDLYKVFIPYDFLIVIYEPNAAYLSERQKKILLRHELMHVGISEKEPIPEYRINPHSVEDFRTILNEYGLDWADPERTGLDGDEDG